MLATPAGRFRAIALAEAVSWLGLLIGMYFKYLGGGAEIGVKIFGPIHGAMFIGYVLITLWVVKPLRWDGRMTVMALLASIPPLCSVLFERIATRKGRLDPVETTAVR
ncbi:MAG: DUF3817 domain-containing protein [Pseudonocardiaceae bacterium]|nr:DUF3817 domain-containing protein [Pseudonocardiaceae bacterium]